MNPRISLSVLFAALLDLAAGGAFAATTAAQTATPAPAARPTILVDNSVARTGVKASGVSPASSRQPSMSSSMSSATATSRGRRQSHRPPTRPEETLKRRENSPSNFQ
jgi:hypothetical protein